MCIVYLNKYTINADHFNFNITKKWAHLNQSTPSISIEHNTGPLLSAATFGVSYIIRSPQNNKDKKYVFIVDPNVNCLIQGITLLFWPEDTAWNSSRHATEAVICAAAEYDKCNFWTRQFSRNQRKCLSAILWRGGNRSSYGLWTGHG